MLKILPPSEDVVSSSLIPAGGTIVTLRFLTGLFVTVSKEDFLGVLCVFSTTSMTLGCFLVSLGVTFGSILGSSSLSVISIFT